jgi:cytochrome b561
MDSAAAQQYSNTARLGHWLSVLLLAGSFTLGYVMTELAMSPTKLKYFSYHKWIGVTVFALAVLRLGWRLRTQAPSLPATMPAWERSIAAATHGLLYLLLLLVPLSGWLMSSAKGFQTVYLGRWPIPDLIGKDAELGGVLQGVHEQLSTLLLILIALHVLAALKHHFIDRDEVLARMVPGLGPRSRRD